MDEAIPQFDFEKLETEGFRVSPRVDLEPGEDAFFYAGSTPGATYGFSGPAGGGKVFDFGVDRD